MHIRHVVRGGLIIMGIGIGAMSLTASAGVGTPGAAAASAAGRTAVVASVDDVGVQAAPILPAAASPVAVAGSPVDEVEPVSEPEPDRPVVQAGPGPAMPVEGAITLIDPLVIER